MLGFSAAGTDENATTAHDFRNRFLCIDDLESVIVLPSHLFPPESGKLVINHLNPA
jgi:hypothetical protein